MRETALGSLMAKLDVWFREPINPIIKQDAINDGIESLWETLMQIKLSDFVGSPVNIAFAAGAERTSIVTIPDPTAPCVVNAAAGAGSLPDEYWDCRVTLVTESGSETLPSPVNVVHRLAGGLLTWISPAYAPGVPFPEGIVGYNVYAGRSDAGSTPSLRLAKQNDEVVELDQPWVEPDPGGLSEDPTLPGAPFVNSTGDNIAYIKKLEVQQVDGTYKEWAQSDLGSLLMARAGASLASSSTSQGYAFDLLNGNVIEIRPAAGATLNPRYFPVVRQRRLAFASSELPFQNVSSSIPFLREFALSKIAASVYEEEQAATWAAGAERTRQSIKESQSVSNIKKDKRIIPYLR
jgi:hypothetical protein